MLHQALNPPAVAVPAVTADWRAQTADRVIAVLEEHRATWQYWHLWAETQRQLRGAAIHPADTAGRRRGRGGRGDRPVRPAHPRRRPGRAAGSSCGGPTGRRCSPSPAATSTPRPGSWPPSNASWPPPTGPTGRPCNPIAVDLGLAEAAADGTALDAGQAAMVRTLATDRRRVQLVIAPAGAGKTTALKVLADTWTAGGGHILGLAPSAAAAAQLAEATGIPADTLARLTWALDHHRPLPDWADRIGPKTLLLIDEAGMADTLTLDTAIGHVLDRGGRVCLVGDDRQLGAVGAGGILTDLARRPRRGPAHPAAPLHRPRRSRRHPPGPRRPPRRPSTSTPTATGSRSATPPASPTGCWPPGSTTSRPGLDSLMLAPSRRQVADLNRRARAARLAGPHRRRCEVDAGRREPGQRR